MIENLLSELKLYGALDFYKANTGDIFEKESFIKGMLEEEQLRRTDMALKRRLLTAGFPYVREWEGINDKQNQSIPFKKIKELSNGEFTQNKTNLCFVGAPGLGKTHCLVSIGRDLCRLGMNVLFYTACELVTELEEAKKNCTLSRLMNRLMRPHFLIIDELGFVPFSENGARLLFDVFSKRYETGSIGISTNLSFEKWPEIFGSIELTQALVDRLTHNCEFYTFIGESVRFIESQKKIRKEKGSSKTP